MKCLAKLCLILISLPLTSKASWHYNENGGFGIYQPEGWAAQIKGRSSLLLGPNTDTDQTEIFLGSDWVNAENLEQLRQHMQRETGLSDLHPASISGLSGFRGGNVEKGAIYLMRIPQNVIVIRYEIRGSPDQREEGKTMLSSVDIRRRANE